MVYVQSNMLSTYYAQIVCDWTDYKERMVRLTKIVQDQLERDRLPSVDCHKSMLYPFTAVQRRAIAASRANLYTDRVSWLSSVVVSEILYGTFSNYLRLCHLISSTFSVNNGLIKSGIYIGNHLRPKCTFKHKSSHCDH